MAAIAGIQQPNWTSRFRGGDDNGRRVSSIWNRSKYTTHSQLLSTPVGQKLERLRGID